MCCPEQINIGDYAEEIDQQFGDAMDHDAAYRITEAGSRQNPPPPGLISVPPSSTVSFDCLIAMEAGKLELVLEDGLKKWSPKLLPTDTSEYDGLPIFAFWKVNGMENT